MGPNLGTAWIQVKPSMKGIQKEIQQGLKGAGYEATKQMGAEAAKSSKNVSAGMAVMWGATTAVAMKAIDGIGKLITSSFSAAIKRVDTLNSANRVFKNMGFSANETEKAMKNLNASITGLPTSLNSAVKNVQMLAGSTGDLRKSEEIFSAMNNAILGFGGSAEDVDRAVLQLSQGFADGKINAQTWNSMLNANLGPTLNALADDIGITTGELKAGLSDGTISVEEFQDALIKLNNEGGGGLASLRTIALDATSGIETGIGNMKIAVTRGLADILDAIGVSNISGAFGAIGSAIEGALSGAADIILLLKDNAELATAALAGLSTAIVASVIPNLMKAIPPTSLWSTHLGLLGLRLGGLAKAAFLPGLIGLIAGAIALFVMNAGGVDEAGKKLGDIFSKVGEFAENLIAALPGIISAIVAFVTTEVPKIFSTIMDAMRSEGPGILATLMELVQSMISWFSENIGTFAQMGTEILVGLINGITEAIPGLVEAAVRIIEGLTNAIVENLPMIIEAGLAILQGLIDAITENLPMIIAAAILLMSTLLNGLIQALPVIVEAALQIIMALANAIIENLPMIIEAAIQLITALVEGLIEMLPAIIEAGITLLTALIDAIIGMLPQLIEMAIQLITALAEALVAAAPMIIAAGIQLIIALAGALIKSLPQILGAAAQLMIGLIGAIIKVVPQLLSAGVKLITALVKGIGNMVGSVASGIGKIAKTILNAIKNIDLVESGKAIIRGFINGIKNMIGAAGRAASDVVAKVRGFFPFSPAKEGPFSGRGYTTYAGRALMEDFGKGMLKESSALERVMNKAIPRLEIPSAADSIKGMYDDLKAVRDISLSTGGLKLAAATAQPAAAPVFNITNPDPEQTADIVAQRLRKGGW